MENTLRVQLWQSVAKLPIEANSPEWETLRRHNNIESPQELQELMGWVHQQFSDLLAEDVLTAP
ncbi:MAG: hypothetical protein Q9M28_05720, partial [Mariprofundaceae bacterium]|nr:hypothetical protein [Mariprofundaceae bacterium]